jgi:glycosyltransferase involved in cell wall biosynthesis
MADPVISVIVPVWNDEKRIGQCIEALKRQSLDADLFEIIVVDNGSTDSTVSLVGGSAGVILLHEPQPGSYAARNTGLDFARGEYAAFTDSDCMPQSDWLEVGLNAVRGRAEIGIIAGRIAIGETTGTYNRACLNYERYLSMPEDGHARYGFAITANWFSRRQILLEKGGFDATLKSGGDLELSRRIFKAGLQIVYLPTAVVVHPPRIQIGEIVGKARRVVGGRWASTRGRLRLLKRMKTETKNFIQRTRKIAGTKNLTAYERVEVAGLLLRLWIISLAELLRLQFGGTPTRS